MNLQYDYSGIWKNNTFDTDMPSKLPKKWNEKLKVLQEHKRKKRSL